MAPRSHAPAPKVTRSSPSVTGSARGHTLSPQGHTLSPRGTRLTRSHIPVLRLLRSLTVCSALQVKHSAPWSYPSAPGILHSAQVHSQKPLRCVWSCTLAQPKVCTWPEGVCPPPPAHATITHSPTEPEEATAQGLPPLMAWPLALRLWCSRVCELQRGFVLEEAREAEG